MAQRSSEHRKRRVSGGLLGWVSLLLALVGWVLVAGYVVSRVVTDRFGWSQWVWWVPGMWWVVGVWGLWVASGVIGWVSVVRGGRYGKRVAVRRVLLVGCVVVGVLVLLGEQRWHRAVVGDHGISFDRPVEDRGESLRVVHWNIAASTVDVGAFVGLVDRMDADVVLIANARWDGQRDELRDRVGGAVGIDSVPADPGPVEPGAVDPGQGADEWSGSLSIGRALIVSRFRVSASVVYMGLGDGAQEDGIRGTGRFGWVAMMTVHRGEERGGDVLVWLVDSPSEPTAIRRETFALMAEKIGERIDRWEEARDAGRVVLPISEWGVVDRPALLIGDFNTPRGSGSLGVFDVFEAGDGFDDAFVQSGYGMARSWAPEGRNPVERAGIAIADWHIDLALTGNGWEAGGYGVVRSFEGRALGASHGVQVVDIRRRD